jgi:hypothetical protein
MWKVLYETDNAWVLSRFPIGLFHEAYTVKSADIFQATGTPGRKHKPDKVQARDFAGLRQGISP